ncbi:alpha/beta-hydrolase [Daedaleopsis nitida]|nr:alpha/beta-hydrolase [Daedaleopsis nitida]
MARLTAFFLCTVLALAGRATAGASIDSEAAPQRLLQVPHGARQLSDVELASYAPFTHLARTAYCKLSHVKAWDCGPCKQVPDFQVMETGGDGDGVQQFFIGYWPVHNAVVVGHEGTDPRKLLSDLTDMGFIQRTLDSALFPGIPSYVKVHHGFANEHEKTGPTILAKVHLIIRETKATSVIMVGHSLGGALSELDAMYLTLNLPLLNIPWNVSVSAVTYGTPRVGNLAWAELFDYKVENFTRINNGRDPVTIMPPLDFGFEHPRGEIHIMPTGKAYACTGEEDAIDEECTLLGNPSIDIEYWMDHLGPYGGIMVGTNHCE